MASSKNLSNDELDNALRVIRKRKKFTQQQAADLVGMSRSLWSALECKQRPLTVALMNKIQVAFDLPDEDMLYIRRWWADSHCNLDAA